MHEDIPPRVAWRRTLWTFLLGLIVPWSGLLPYDYEPKHECRVEVRRRSDDRLVVAYDYDQELEAINHVGSLRERSGLLTVAEFDRALGLGANWT